MAAAEKQAGTGDDPAKQQRFHINESDFSSSPRLSTRVSRKSFFRFGFAA
jgi:hypothetical protein